MEDMNFIECPEIDPKLIEYLDAAFPDRMPDPDRENVDRLAGNVEVVRHLKAVKALQDEEVYVPT